MGYRNLSPQTMLNISGPWLDPEQDRKIFTSLPLLAALLPAIEEAHQGLRSTQRLGTLIQQQMRALIDRSVALDAVYDRKLRGGWNYLGALAEVTDDAAFASAVLDLRDRLIPGGLKALSRSHPEQASDARLLPSRLDDASSKLLKRLRTPDGPFSQVVEAWVAAALELEKVEAERADLEEMQGVASGVTPRDVVSARNAWIRVVRAVETNLALEKAATEEIVKRLLGRLRREEAKADRRGRKVDMTADGHRESPPKADEGSDGRAPDTRQSG